MANPALEQQSKTENPENGSETVDQMNKLREKRSLMHGLLDDIDRNNFATSKTVQQYRDAVDADPTLDGVDGFYTWMKGEWEKANSRLESMKQKMNQGIREKTMSDVDRDHLMEKLLLTNDNDFIGELDKAEEILNEKIKKRKDDREAFDVVRGNPLAEGGMIVVSAQTQIAVPSEADYLKMKVPERRKMLELAKTALPMAKKYAETVDEQGSKELNTKYEGMLGKTKSKKIIGTKTYNKFLNSFKKLSTKDKEHWSDEKTFLTEMSRYELLWKQIRNTFKGDTLEKEFEQKRDEFGYTDLFNKLGIMRAKESDSLEESYIKNLEGYLDNHVISQHTFVEFTTDFKRQNLDGKYKYTDQLENQMNPYKVLQQRESSLNKKQREILDHFWDEWGKTERDEFLKNPKDAKYKDAIALSRPKGSTTIESIQDTGIAEAIKDASEGLDKRGAETKRTFVSRIKRMFERKSTNEIDATDFQSQLQEKRKQNRLVAEGNEIDLQMDDSNVICEEGFEQVESMNIKGKTERITKLEVNKSKGMDRWITEDQSRNFKAEMDGGHDDLRIAIQKKDGSSHELKSENLRKMIKHMEEELDEAA